ncbi:MAG: hypothetical protein JXR86_15635 [Spirochaetales bacterium]|nr:hypothetical protein [Spirochaetales bacterium]
MSRETVMSYINVFAVLKNMEELVRVDSVSEQLIKSRNIAIQFTVHKGPKAVLAFRNGEVMLTRGGGKADIKLYFFSPEHFNRMMDGKANPVPYKGLTKISFLTGTFMKLAERLEYYLRPDEEKLKDRDYFRANTEMTAYAAFFALSEIGNHDEKALHSSHAIPDGTILVKVVNGPAVTVIKEKGSLRTVKGEPDSPRCILSFSSLESAHLVLNGKLDTYTALATGRMAMRGFIPMIENMNPILDQVAEYLQ